MDRVNLQIVELLQKDGRMSISEMAREVNRGESTVRERVAALEAAGVIRGYQAVVEPPRLGYHVHALLSAECDPRATVAVSKRLQGIPEVVSIRLTTGPRPLRIEVWAESLPRLKQLVESRIASAELREIETAIIVNTLLESRPLVPMRVSLAPSRAALDKGTHAKGDPAVGSDEGPG